MKIYAVLIFDDKDTITNRYYELSDFGWFSRGTIKEFMTFFALETFKRTEHKEKSVIKFNDKRLTQGYYCFLHKNVAVITDNEYPTRSAFDLINKIGSSKSEELEALIKAYQDPIKQDKLLSIQKQLDDIKNVMVKNMDDLLKRGETLDSLMSKSEELSQSSLKFYKKAETMNSYCKW